MTKTNIRQVLLLCILGVLSLFICSPTVSAQDNTGTGNLRGTVTFSADGSPAPGVNVRVLETQAGAATDIQGRYRIDGLLEGEYTLEFSFVGHRTERRAAVHVLAGQVVAVDVALRESPFLLDEVVVTGTLSSHLLKNTPVVTEVISRSEIEAVGSSDLADVMRSQTGIEIASGIGRTQSAQLHGLSDSHVLVLIDGERVTGKVDGAVDLGQIPLQSIEKIEVVKGPLSAKYGSDALGGVINIITRDPARGPKAQLSVTGGENGRQDYEASGGHVFREAFSPESSVSLFANASWHKYFGVDYDESDNFMELPEYDRKSFGLKTGIRASSRVQLNLRGEYYTDESIWLAGDRAVYFKDLAGNDKLTGSFSGDYLFDPTTTLRLSAHYSKNDHTFEERGRSGAQVQYAESAEEVETYRTQFSMMPYGASILTLGYEYNVERAVSDRIVGQEKAYYSNVLYGEDEWSIDDVTLSVGLRWSHNSVYGSFFAPRAALLYKATEKLTFRGSYGRGFRAPSIKELFIDFPNTGVGYIVEGEPTLKPETSNGYNLGIQYARGDVIWFRVNVYYNDLENLIDYYLKSTNPNVLSYRNIASAVTKGFDVDVDIEPVNDFIVTIGYAYTSATDGDGNDLPFRTPHMLHGKLSWNWMATGLRSSLRTRWFDKQLITDEQINLDIYKGGGEALFSYTPQYLVMDVKFSRMFFDRLDLTAGVNNVFDERHYPFGQIRGREWYAGASIIFK